MQIHRLTPQNSAFPDRLRHIPQPPKELFARGNLKLLEQASLAVVGSRAVTNYGKQVTQALVKAVAGSIVIVSGLALGLDSVAHRAALDAEGPTIAVLPGGIERIYPATHYFLAQHIIKQGGLLLSEYGGEQRPQKQHFIARNRIIAGLADAVLIPEAAEHSGSLHTANFALEQGKDILTVPGDIFRTTTAGSNNLIKTGAIPITDPQDLFDYFGIDRPPPVPLKGDTPHEQLLISLLQREPLTGPALLAASKLSIQTFNQTLTLLEVKGIAQLVQGVTWTLIT